MSLTRAQHRVYVAIEHFIRERHYSPSYQEIAIIVGVRALATVSKHIHSLEQKGYIRHGYNQSRSLEIVPEQLRSLKSCSDGHDLIFFHSEKCPMCSFFSVEGEGTRGKEEDHKGKP